MKFPESEKVAAAADDAQAIGEFLDWLQAVYGHTVGEDGPEGRLPKPVRALLHEYYEVDEERLEEERRYMLRQARRMGYDWEAEP